MCYTWYDVTRWFPFCRKMRTTNYVPLQGHIISDFWVFMFWELIYKFLSNQAAYSKPTPLPICPNKCETDVRANPDNYCSASPYCNLTFSGLLSDCCTKIARIDGHSSGGFDRLPGKPDFLQSVQSHLLPRVRKGGWPFLYFQGIPKMMT
jgi:hypothetical protein